MNDQMFDMYRQATESWLKMQQDLFDGLYKSAILLFQTSEVPKAKPPEDHPPVAGAHGSKVSKATRKPTQKPTSRTSRHSRKVAGKRPV
jgi:hypothetical protein